MEVLNGSVQQAGGISVKYRVGVFFSCYKEGVFQNVTVSSQKIIYICTYVYIYINITSSRFSKTYT